MHDGNWQISVRNQQANSRGVVSMIVKELIEQLERYNENSRVSISIDPLHEDVHDRIYADEILEIMNSHDGTIVILCNETSRNF